ncbi:MAG: E3 ubiquitin ligase family protein [Actinomycetota bacterium]|nr:E3 ubiquitin ligase family protein [Actinomycetota bacterium]
MVAFVVLLLFAVIFLVAGGVLLYFRNRTKQKSALMSQTETSSASEVSGLAPGTLVEVRGTLRCEEPLTSEMAEKTCAYFSSTVVREYLERDYDDDDVGSDRHSEVMAQNEQFAPFVVEDDSGSVAVNAEGAEVDARQVVNRFDRNTGNEGTFSLGGVTINLGGGERTIGYRYTESILPVDESVYVLGTVQESGEIGAPQPGEEGHRFVVSYRSEEALGQSLGKTVFWLGAGGVAALVLGVVLLVGAVIVLLS